MYRHSSQEVCPWNARFARALPNDSPFSAREALAGTDARTLARELLGMSSEEFSAALRGSPMKRAKLRGLNRNAALVLGNVGAVESLPALDQALAEPDPLVREHAAWALGRIRGRVPGLLLAADGPGRRRPETRSGVPGGPR